MTNRQMKAVNKSLDDKIIIVACELYRNNNDKEMSFQLAWEMWNNENFDYDMLEVDKKYILENIR